MLISELSKKAGVANDSIRHYVDLGLLNLGELQAGSREYYDFHEKDLDRLDYIAASKELGFTLNEIKPYMDLFLEDSLSLEQIVSAFSDKLDELDKKIADIDKMRERLRKKIVMYRS